jgi:hypothetical protein
MVCFDDFFYVNDTTCTCFLGANSAANFNEHRFNQTSIACYFLPLLFGFVVIGKMALSKKFGSV